MHRRRADDKKQTESGETGNARCWKRYVANYAPIAAAREKTAMEEEELNTRIAIS